MCDNVCAVMSQFAIDVADANAAIMFLCDAANAYPSLSHQYIIRVLKKAKFPN